MTSTVRDPVASAGIEYLVSAVTDWKGFSGLRDEWTDLLLNSQKPNLFLSWEWMSAWAETLQGGSQPYILVARRPQDDMLLGLAPLYRKVGWRNLGLRRIGFMGWRTGAGQLTFLVREGMPTVADALAEWLLGSPRWGVLEFGGIAEELAARLTEVIARQEALTSTMVQEGRSPHIRLPTTWEAYLNTIGGRRRSEISRKSRRLRERGEPVIQRVTTRAELDRAWPLFISLRRMRGAARGGPEAVLARRDELFHERVARLCLERGWLRLDLMWMEGHCVAASYWFNLAGHAVGFMSAFDARWTRYSPGTMLVTHGIREAIQERAAELYIAGHDEPHKYEWGATTVTRDVSLLVWRSHPLVALAMRARRLARTMRRSLRLGRRRIPRKESRPRFRHHQPRLWDASRGSQENVLLVGGVHDARVSRAV